MGLAVALIEPQIPPNTGNIARLCAATETALHVIQPLGFDLDDAHLRRAGCDYWDDVEMWIHPHWRAFRDAVSRDRCLYFSAHGTRSYLEAELASNSVLVFGNETHGMPAGIREKHPEQVFRVPMGPAVRCLNLATTVGIVLYDAIRRLDISIESAQVINPPESSANLVEQDGNEQ